jgi:hypothetical protein
MATVKYGWVIRDQAAAVSGLSKGPHWLRGKTHSGPVSGGYHNLLTKDIVFIGEGKKGGALQAILQTMKGLSSVKIRCGIREGMEIEDFKDSEYGGGMDEFRRKATEDDIVRMEYYGYVMPYDRFKSAFNAELMRIVSGLTGFASASNLAVDKIVLAADFSNSVFYMKDKIGQQMAAHDTRSDLRKAMSADDVIVVFTGTTLKSATPVVKHKHTHSMTTFAQEINNAMMRER